MKRYKIVAGCLLPGMTMTFAGTICLFIPIGDQVFLFVLVSIGVATTLIGMVMWCSSSGREELVFEGSVSIKPSTRDGRASSTGDMSDLLLPQKPEAKTGSSLGTNSDPSIRCPSYYCQASRPIQFGVSWTRPKPEPEQISPSATPVRVPVLPPAIQTTPKPVLAPILRTSTVQDTPKTVLSSVLRSPTPVQTTPKPVLPTSAPSLSPSGFSTDAWVSKPASVSSPQLSESNSKTKSPLPVILHPGDQATLPLMRNPETAV